MSPQLSRHHLPVASQELRVSFASAQEGFERSPLARSISSPVRGSRESLRASCESQRGSRQSLRGSRDSLRASQESLRSSCPLSIHDGYYEPAMFEVLDSVESALWSRSSASRDVAGQAASTAALSRLQCELAELEHRVYGNSAACARTELRRAPDAPEDVVTSTPPSRSREAWIVGQPNQPARESPRTRGGRSVGVVDWPMAGDLRVPPDSAVYSVQTPPMLQEIDDVLSLLPLAPGYA